MDRRAVAPAPRGPDAVSLLGVSGVTKRFGGITANRNISFEVAAGELVGVIGPNGSGKSTLFEIISGFYHPDEGEVRLDGRRLTGLSPDRVCRLGVARTFQKLRPFPGSPCSTTSWSARSPALGRAPRARAGARRS